MSKETNYLLWGGNSSVSRIFFANREQEQQQELQEQQEQQRVALGNICGQNHDRHRMDFIGHIEGFKTDEQESRILPRLLLNWTNSPLHVFIYIQKATPKGDNQTHA